MPRYLTGSSIPTLDIALSDGVTAAELKKLAALTDEKMPTRKADIAAVIKRRLDGDGLRTLWQGLDPIQRAAVAEVVHSNSTAFQATQFRAKYGCDPNWGTEERFGYNRKPSALRLLFYGDGVIPDDVAARLKAFVPRPAAPKIATLAELPASADLPRARWDWEDDDEDEDFDVVPLTVHESEQTAQRELNSVLRLIDAGKVSVSAKTQRASAATVEVITACLEGGDYYPHIPVTRKWDDENAGPIRAFAWPLLVQVGGLALLSGSRLQLTKAGRKALTANPAATLRTLWSKWLGSRLLDELSRIDCVKGQTGKGKAGLIAVSSRRRAIAKTLAECPTGVWITADEVFRFIRASGVDYTVTRDPWNLYLSSPQYGTLAYDGGERALDERYLFAFLLEYAATLGLLDVALIPPAGARPEDTYLWGADGLPYFSRYDGLMYLRITPIGAWCLGHESAGPPAAVEAKPVLSVLANFELAATGAELAQGDRLALDAYATRVSDLVWRLDASKLLAAIEDGRPLAELRQFLTSRSATVLPDTVSRLLDDIAVRITKVQDRGSARLVECEDAALAALIAHDTRTRRHCMRAGDQHLVVPQASDTAFRRGLRELGYIVSAGGAKLAPPPPADEAPITPSKRQKRPRTQ